MIKNLSLLAISISVFYSPGVNAHAVTTSNGPYMQTQPHHQDCIEGSYNNKYGYHMSSRNGDKNFECKGPKK